MENVSMVAWRTFGTYSPILSLGQQGRDKLGPWQARPRKPGWNRGPKRILWTKEIQILSQKSQIFEPKKPADGFDRLWAYQDSDHQSSNEDKKLKGIIICFEIEIHWNSEQLWMLWKLFSPFGFLFKARALSYNLMMALFVNLIKWNNTE